MNSNLQIIGCLVFFVFSIAQIIAGYLGLEYYIGAFWTGVVFFVAVTLRFTLPVTIGTFLGALKVWGWHWFFAACFTAPGLLLAIPGVLTSILSFIRNKNKTLP